VILVIDTSAALAVMAAIRPGVRDELVFNARETPLAMQYPYIVGKQEVEKVAVVTGPGSFTGLRVGVSFGLGLAIGLRVPIVPLPTLDVQATRSRVPATAVVDAGRGRFYYQEPGGRPALGQPADIVTSHPLVGNVADPRMLVAAGHRFVADAELRSFVDAADILLRTAPEVPYRNLEITYMQTFSPRQI
jgi:tRNA threonylcarbamoyl adenosine modification protein YeaZ